MTSPGETPNARLILRNRSSVASNSECQAGRAFSVDGPHTASANREWQLVILGSQHSGVCLEFWHEYRQSCLLHIRRNSLLTSLFGGMAAH